jgi:hypothetical protein
MYIWVDIEDTKKLATLCAHFVREGLTFEVTEKGHRWLIELTGGF